MSVAEVAAITFFANTGKSVPAGTVSETAAESSTHLRLTTPAPPTHKALQPVRSVESDGVTAATRRAEKRAVGLEGVKSGINHLKNWGLFTPIEAM